MRGRNRSTPEHPGELQQLRTKAGNLITRSASVSLVSRLFIFTVNRKQLTHYKRYFSLFDDHSERVVTNKLSYLANQQTVFCAPQFLSLAVTTTSDWNLRSRATPIDYLGPWFDIIIIFSFISGFFQSFTESFAKIVIICNLYIYAFCCFFRVIFNLLYR